MEKNTPPYALPPVSNREYQPLGMALLPFPLEIS